MRGSAFSKVSTGALIGTALALLVACSGATPDLSADAEAIYRTTLVALSDSLDVPLLVLPTAGGPDPLLDMAYDSLDETYLTAVYPDVQVGLILAGRQANEMSTTLGPISLARVHLLSADDERMFLTSLGAAWQSLRGRFGNDARTVRFAQPAMSASGNQALVYYVCSELYLGGVSSGYALLLRQPDGDWRVSWQMWWEVE